MPPPSPSARINTANIFKDMVKNDSDRQPNYRAVYCNSTGTMIVTDDKDNETTWNVTVGQIIPIQPKLFKTASGAELIGLN